MPAFSKMRYFIFIVVSSLLFYSCLNDNSTEPYNYSPLFGTWRLAEITDYDSSYNILSHTNADTLSFAPMKSYFGSKRQSLYLTIIEDPYDELHTDMIVESYKYESGKLFTTPERLVTYSGNVLY